MLNVDAISIRENPETFRRRVEQIRREAVGRIALVVENITGAYTPNLENAGLLHQFNDAADRAWTLPANFPQGWWIDIQVLNTGRPSFTGANALGGVARISGQWGRGRLEVVSNVTGSAAVWMLSGDVG